MPPKKKGKKLAGNPARGFATVSIASKPKEPVEEIQESSGNTKGAQNPVGSAGQDQDLTNNDKNERPDLSSLSPEELEARLEEDELQLIVEKHGELVKKEALRTSNRFKTDRRVLRGQSDPLNIRPWLSDELQDEIFRLILADDEETSRSNGRIQANFSISDDLLTKIWQLKQTLLNLDFASTDVDDCLRWIMSSPKFAEEGPDHKRRLDGWGLDSCLTWLCMHCPTERLPDYFTHQNASLEKVAREEESRREVERQEALTRARPRQETSKPEPILSKNSGEIDQDVDNISSEEEGFDPDNPEHLTEKYLKLMRRLFQIKPELTQVAQPGKKKGKAPPKPNLGNEPAKVQRLFKLITALESDMLFDADGAKLLWMSVRQDMMIEEKSQKRAKPGASQRDKTQENDASVSEKLVPETTLEEADNDSIVGLGDLMDSLPEESPPDETNLPDTVAFMVKSRDFGKWSGVHPRRIIEEACRARDSAARLSFQAIGTGLSKRHLFQVQWSHQQDLRPTCPLSEVKLEYTKGFTSFTMIGIAVPDDNQAEAYIATVSLFGLFSTSAKEEKAYLRLPPVWKSLYQELRTASKELSDATDRKELKHLRTILEMNVDDSEKTAVPISAHVGTQNLSVDAKDDNREQNNVEVDSFDPDTVRRIWSMKSSSQFFKEMEAQRSTLPMWSFKKEILRGVHENQVVIICGETGCGKSTQTPSFILEDEMSNGRNCKIYCTEPRRISAISLARRVSQELGEKRNDLGTNRALVGYSIRLESKITPSTRLVFATTGIVMRMLERDPELKEVTHLILDEVHERTIDSDFLLIVLKRLMTERPMLKVVLMSATVNAERFSKYLNDAPVFNVPGRTYPVEVKYLEDAIETTGYGSTEMNNSDRKTSPDQASLGLSDDDADDVDTLSDKANLDEYLKGYKATTRTVLKNYNEYRINFELILSLLEKIAKAKAYEPYSKAILVFLPGINEIRRLNDMLGGHTMFGSNWQVFPLHSTIATEEQEKAFRIPPKGVRKIVLATNIAETGITIPDITCVVDTGTHREMRYDERRQLSRLIESFISRANAKQRRGRAGRVQNGLCFHLFTHARHDKLMADQQTPEIMRLSLQDLVLRVKTCQMGDIEKTLSEALDPPSAKNIRRAIDYLVDVKALTGNEELTPLGRQLAKLPLDVFLGKMIILGSAFKCLDSCLSIAAILSSKSPFSAPMSAKHQADQARLGFKKGDSDLLTNYNAYCAWRRTCRSTGASEFEFCRKNYLNSQTLVNIEELKGQLTASIVDAGFLQGDEQLQKSLSQVRSYSRQRSFVELPFEYMINDGRDNVTNSVIAWSFYPKLLMREGKGWRNVSSNQMIQLHSTSTNKTGFSGRYLSYYHLMQSAGKAYNAHETSSVDDFAILLACGDADFKLYTGIAAIDSNRMRFALPSWKSLLLVRSLRNATTSILAQKFRTPQKKLTNSQASWMQVLQKCFEEKAEAAKA